MRLSDPKAFYSLLKNSNSVMDVSLDNLHAHYN